MTKRILISLVVLALIATGLWYALNTPVLTTRLIKSSLKNLKGYTLEELSIGSQQWTAPDRVVFSSIQCRLKSKDNFYHVLVRRIECAGWSPIKVYIQEIAVESGQIVSKPGEVRGSVYLKGLHLDRFEGEAKIPSLEAYRYRLQNVSSHIDGTLKKMALRDLKADSYQGKLSGQILLDWQKDLPYSIDIHFDNVDLRPMKEINPSIGQVEGIVSGSITISGNTTNFNTLDLKANVTKDGRVNASLLRFVSPYIPRTQEAVALDGMMQRGEKIPVEIAAMELRSIDAHKLSGFVKIFVGKLNLDLNLPIDILYDGNLISLIEWYRRLNP